MDELVEHCLRELAFDGELGCNVSRLTDFIHDFHNSNPTHPQVQDSTYHSFVWSIISQQPAVRIGIPPPGQNNEVYVPLQAKAAKKAKDAGTDQQVPTAMTLQVIPEARVSSLEDLSAKYGDRLRIAVDPETSFAAITGSHVRPSKLSPMVYAALQFISRARESGISVTDLGKKTGYDQKTCFYLVKQLIILDLIVKLRRGGNSQNFCVHKYFFERNSLWKQIRDEEARGTQDDPVEIEGSDEDREKSQTPRDAVRQQLRFDPIDSRHLSSLTLIRSRLVKLLKHSGGVHIYHNIMLSIGFLNPTRTERRFFITRLRELIAEGTIEKVLVPTDSSRSATHRLLCIRLVPSEENKVEEVEGAVVLPVDTGDDDKEEETMILQESGSIDTGVKANATVHKQLVDLLDASGSRGMTLSELSTRVGDFDRRTLELLLTRLEKYPPPPHLADLGIAQVMETHGRERRHRYFTISGYKALVEQERLDDPNDHYAHRDLSASGGFFPFQPTEVYETTEELVAFQDSFKNLATGKSKPGYKSVNPILPDGTRKKGRPRKVQVDGEATPPNTQAKANGEGGTPKPKRGTKRKQPDDGAGADGSVEAPKKARKPNTKKARIEEEAHPTAPESAEAVSKKSKQSVKSKKKVIAVVEDDATAISPTTKPSHKKSRGLKATPNVPRTEDDHDLQIGSSKALAKDNETIIEQQSKGSVSERTFTNENAMAVDSSPPTPLPRPAPVDDELSFAPPEVPVQRPVASEESSVSTEVTDQRRRPKTPSRPPKKKRRIVETEPRSTPQAVSTSEVMPPADYNPTHDLQDAALQQAAVKPAIAEPEALAGESRVEDVVTTRVIPTIVISPPSPSPLPVLQFPEDRQASTSNEPSSSTRRSSRARKPVVPADGIIRPPITKKQPRASLKSTLMDIAEGSTQDGQNTSQKSPEGAQPFADSAKPERSVDHGSPKDTPSSSSPLRADMTEHDRVGLGIDIDKLDHVMPSVSMTGERDTSVGSNVEIVKASSARAKPNLSQSRRENELLRLLDDLGGIVNTSTREFIEAHVALLESLVKAGEPASAPPGTRLDRRTLETALNNLESRGRIKIVTTTVAIPTGGVRAAKVVYLSTLEQSTVGDFLKNLSKTIPPPQVPVVPHIESNLTHTAHTPRKGRPLQILADDQPGEEPRERWNRNLQRADQLFTYSDDIIREILLMEKQTSAQLYGFVTGKAARARELHIATLRCLEPGEYVSPRIVSRNCRIIDINLYHEDLSISEYCSLIPAQSQEDELERLLSSENGPQRRLKDLPESLKHKMQIGRSRARTRVVDILDVLRILKVVTPLIKSNSPDPWIRCSPNGHYPTAFDPISVPDDAWLTIQTAPQFWCFNSVAPIFLWSVSVNSPPFHKDVPIDSVNDALTFWAEMQKVCGNTEYASTLECPNEGSKTGPPNLSNTMWLRRKTWQSSYLLSWHQQQYLGKFVDVDGNTPFQDADGGAVRLQRICYVVCAPMDAVRRFFITTRAKQLREIDKADDRKNRKSDTGRTRLKAEEKALLAKKASEANQQRELDWDKMVQIVHPQVLSGPAAAKVKYLRNSYLQGVPGKHTQQWQEDIARAIEDAEKTNGVQKLFKKSRFALVKPSRYIPAPPLIASLGTEKAVEALIAQQGEPLPAELKRRQAKRGGGNKGKEPEKPSGTRQHRRFLWTNEYDELARDASVIVRARCRYNHRPDWSALEQVFPAVPRNGVRQRIAALRAAPGAEGYLNRLEDAWHDLWVLHRGTALLPDEDTSSPSNFSMVKHIEFLRRHIDKNAVRVGFSKTSEMAKNVIPATVEELEERYTTTEPQQIAPLWEPMWTAAADESREKFSMKEPFVMEVEHITCNDPSPSSSDVVKVAESALKMAIGNPNDSFNHNRAANMLHIIGDQAISLAQSNLLSQNVLSKLVRDPKKSAPGRTMKISEHNQSALGGNILRDTFLDAAQLEDLYAQEQGAWREWPLLSTDGDTAALIQLVSDHKVEFLFDASQSHARRVALDWNSKKADDEDLEMTSIQIRVDGLDLSPPLDHQSSPQPGTAPIADGTDTSVGTVTHGFRKFGGPACCSRNSDGALDCQACLEESLASLQRTVDHHEMDLTNSLLDHVVKEGSRGANIQHIMALIGGNTSRSQILTVIKRLSTATVPLFFWTGYASAVLVSSHYISAWTVVVSEPERALTRVYPRRWVDISGERIPEVWNAALRAVTSVVLQRPGVCQAELRWRLKAVYDRQEVNDVLEHLVSGGNVERRLDPRYENEMSDIEAAGAEEEKATFWFCGQGRHWFQVM
ncbi:hypothetical protein BD410DRAFT_738661 [Rickenella mellea]|uniref:Uncharacterized protein n=1 Tax=Rickenella mellea TaxID=50990 RepID=A0A4Y7QPQ0_9AGAM|nr:hypothetical protein BD410DRAFT_738661 [Rickenella mellea]